MRICFVLRKPPSYSPLAQNVINLGCGALNIDKSRIPEGPQGRWPANIIFLHTMSCVCVGEAQGTPKQLTAGNRVDGWGIGEGGCSYEKGTGARFAAPAIIKVWSCSDDCAVQWLDDSNKKPNDKSPGLLEGPGKSQTLGEGSISRFFKSFQSD